MTRTDFLDELKNLIKDYPVEETEKSIECYNEMIDDRIEDGMSEEDAVKSLGDVKDIAKEIEIEMPMKTIVKKKVKEKKEENIPIWVILLLVLGFPVWAPLLLALGIGAFSLYIALWSVVLALWAVDAALFVSVIAGLLAIGITMVKGSMLSAIIYFGATLVLIGLALLGLIGCFYASKGLAALFAAIFKSIKKKLVSKNEKEKEVE
ncbi:MAG: DUF1700 domain-containing protein [Lachnospiraceae bacterium]|nr:DUF1700 domain-containing protein [Lachnospiraceae bacterium]